MAWAHGILPSDLKNIIPSIYTAPPILSSVNPENSF